MDKATPEEIAHSEERYELLSTQYAIPFMIWAPLDPAQDTYNVSIILRTPVQVSGRVIDAVSGNGIAAMVDTAAWDTDAIADDSGDFVLTAMPKDTAVELAILPDSPFVFYHSVSAAQTAGDLALGDISIPTYGLDGRISINVTNREWLQDRNGLLINEVIALIRDDGAYALNYHVNELNQAFDEQTGVYPDAPLSVPAGTYYAVPGLWGHDTHTALRAALLAGRQTQLDAAGVPRIIVPDDGTPVTLNVDATAARDAVLQVGGDLLGN